MLAWFLIIVLNFISSGNSGIPPEQYGATTCGWDPCMCPTPPLQ